MRSSPTPARPLARSSSSVRRGSCAIGRVQVAKHRHLGEMVDELAVRPANDSDERKVRVEPVGVRAIARNVELNVGQRFQRRSPTIDRFPQIFKSDGWVGTEVNYLFRL